MRRSRAERNRRARHRDCPQGKVRYPDQESAKQVITAARQAVARTGDTLPIPQRAYPCPTCAGWHLTSQAVDTGGAAWVTVPSPHGPATVDVDDGPLPIIDLRCSDGSCSDRGEYLMVGVCAACRDGPFLLRITRGHETGAGITCPACTARTVRITRLPLTHETPQETP